MNDIRLSDMTLDDLWLVLRDRVQTLIRDTLQESTERLDLKSSDLSDFPVDSYGSWPEDLSLRREDMYDDDQR